MSHFIADRLRELAEEIEKNRMDPPGPDMTVADAVRRLRDSYQSAGLIIEIEWRDYKAEVTVEYKVRNCKDYKIVATGESLLAVVNKALADHAPHDTLDRLEALMPKVEVKA